MKYENNPTSEYDTYFALAYVICIGRGVDALPFSERFNEIGQEGNCTVTGNTQTPTNHHHDDKPSA